MYQQTGGSATIGQTTGPGQVTITGGQTTLTPNGGTSVVSGLTMWGTGKLDITNNELVIDYGSAPDPISTIVSYLTSGTNGGAWTGYGLFSSTAAADPALYSVGYLDSSDPGGVAGEILVKYTLIGDATLSGAVNFTDLLAVQQNFNKTGKDWAEGNFTYNPRGLVSFTDLLMAVQNLGESLTPPGGSTINMGDPIESETAAIPEPGSMALVIGAAAGLLGGRRRRK